MNVFECIRTRRSIRKYKDKPVPWDSIVEILQAGKYAPFAGNILNVKLIVVKISLSLRDGLGLEELRINEQLKNLRLKKDMT